MAVRFITGNLADDPEVQQAGRVKIVKLTVLENTATRRGDEWVPGHKPLRHDVEAKFELGENIEASLHKGDAVVVIGTERDASFDGNEGTVYRRVIDASHVGADLAKATVAITRNAKAD